MGTVKPGDVVVIENAYGKHRYIVLKKDGHICFVAGSTSQVEKRQSYAQKNNPALKNGYLYLKPLEYQSRKDPKECSLTKKTIFDINQIERYIEDTITAQCDRISNEIKTKLISCIARSPALTGEDKECYINNLQ